MQQPNAMHANTMRNYSVSVKIKNGKWVPCRPDATPRVSRFGFVHRVKLAFLVFTGKADALFWEDQ